MKKSGVYRCQICQAKVDDIYSFKRHHFYHHCDLETVGCYKKTMFEFLGKYSHGRLSQPVLTHICKGKFDIFLENLISKDEDIRVQRLDYTYPLSVDLDEEN